eukprot:TRINITY_DN13839_c0_g1_i4.p1 TRINITY_DN13839_c0_g1~~TRINITY_DN13839_c0_g1_i4.p1  ORF type:complete len:814 (+),score=147.45 TRINITY_DN13839_c0_g1_i4:170-2611(+)
MISVRGHSPHASVQRLGSSVRGHSPHASSQRLAGRADWGPVAGVSSSIQLPPPSPSGIRPAEERRAQEGQQRRQSGILAFAPPAPARAAAAPTRPTTPVRLRQEVQASPAAAAWGTEVDRQRRPGTLRREASGGQAAAAQEAEQTPPRRGGGWQPVPPRGQTAQKLQGWHEARGGGGCGYSGLTGRADKTTGFPARQASKKQEARREGSSQLGWQPNFEGAPVRPAGRGLASEDMTRQQPLPRGGAAAAASCDVACSWRPSFDRQVADLCSLSDAPRSPDGGDVEVGHAMDATPLPSPRVVVDRATSPSQLTGGRGDEGSWNRINRWSRSRVPLPAEEELQAAPPGPAGQLPAASIPSHRGGFDQVQVLGGLHLSSSAAYTYDANCARRASPLEEPTPPTSQPDSSARARRSELRSPQSLQVGAPPREKSQPQSHMHHGWSQCPCDPAPSRPAASASSALRSSTPRGEPERCRPNLNPGVRDYADADALRRSPSPHSSPIVEIQEVQDWMPRFLQAQPAPAAAPCPARAPASHPAEQPYKVQNAKQTQLESKLFSEDLPWQEAAACSGEQGASNTRANLLGGPGRDKVKELPEGPRTAKTKLGWGRGAFARRDPEELAPEPEEELVGACSGKTGSPNATSENRQGQRPASPSCSQNASPAGPQQHAATAPPSPGGLVLRPAPTRRRRSVEKAQFAKLKGALAALTSEFEAAKQELASAQADMLRARWEDLVYGLASDEGASPGRRPELLEAFKQLDVEQKGYFSLKDLRRAVTRLGEAFTPQEVAELLTEADCDGDGVVTFCDFTAYLGDCTQ